ncbi:uncharacterized protein LOC141655750 [Silene latifolia]|uniref:uncharacterized protein LOC141655750 n=1 Tax=Silene latifolia TaxID=37657 RepID=UPI003D76F7C9
METCLHLVRGCGWAGGLWDRLGIGVRMAGGYEWVREWVEDVWRELQDGEIDTFMMGCWAIWEVRNKWVFDGVAVDAGKVARRVEELRKEMEDEVRVAGVQDKQEEGRGRWRKPKEGWAKLNVDAGVKEGWGTGLGAVCRNSEDRVLWGMAEFRSGTMEPKMAEAEVVMAGLKEAQARRCRRLVIESDWKVLIDALKSKANGRSEFYLLLDDILDLCNGFESILWSFVSRKHNNVAHELAHLSSSHLGRKFGLVLCPDMLWI